MEGKEDAIKKQVSGWVIYCQPHPWVIKKNLFPHISNIATNN